MLSLGGLTGLSRYVFVFVFAFIFAFVFVFVFVFTFYGSNFIIGATLSYIGFS